MGDPGTATQQHHIDMVIDDVEQNEAGPDHARQGMQGATLQRGRGKQAVACP